MLIDWQIMNQHLKDGDAKKKKKHIFLCVELCFVFVSFLPFFDKNILNCLEVFYIIQWMLESVIIKS